MNLADVRFMFAYDRWATRRVLNRAMAISPEDWARPNAIGERGIGGILLHAYGADLRWRTAWQGATTRPRPELDPLPTATELRTRWEAEWVALDAYLNSLDDTTVAEPFDVFRLWQAMAHVVNHGTQHRSEVAALMTGLGHSPGDLDIVDFIEEQSAD